jgi:hypothetical protein
MIEPGRAFKWAVSIKLAGLSFSQRGSMVPSQIPAALWGHTPLVISCLSCQKTREKKAAAGPPVPDSEPVEI